MAHYFIKMLLVGNTPLNEVSLSEEISAMVPAFLSTSRKTKKTKLFLEIFSGEPGGRRWRSIFVSFDPEEDLVILLFISPHQPSPLTCVFVPSDGCPCVAWLAVEAWFVLQEQPGLLLPLSVARHSRALST
jgi:hypothetical protein